ncbi:GTP-binding protein [Gemmata sp. G18]|uniref:GTP-binding protein n=1 Tax=Gemmata palustris TaxID=2822762 RepID=A0ABS5BXH3_9BACT|nr:GTP-binding protein [Gemmata palustris]MBP3957568.1 GTP-binding protein [Gemmata palustris]
MQSVPTNLITGFLGVGKTTAVIDLLQRKETGSRWAVLVNEYGAVSIDDALIEGSAPEGVTVKEVGGGCVCCASAPFLPVAIHFLLLEARPERLIIETTGLGHPARLLDSLRMSYHGRLDVRATLGIVDPHDFAKPEMRDNPIFIDQIQMADVLVMNKLDTATPELVADFQSWANGLFPPKLLIAGTTQGRIDPAWLDLSANDERFPLYPQEPGFPKGKGEQSRPNPLTPFPKKEGGTESEAVLSPSPFRGGVGEGLLSSPPKRYLTPPACGWVFDPADVFDEAKLLGLLANTKEVTRLKGVFHLADEWAAVNRAGTAMSVAPTAYRRDSRVEVFAEGLDWDRFERELMACLFPVPTA